MAVKSVSVIIPALNEERTVAGIVQSVLTWRDDVQVIVVDDGSIDGTYASVARFKTRLTLIRQKNMGQGAAIAAGLVKAQNEIILCIDADVTSVTHFDLDAMIAPLEKGSEDMAIAVLQYWKKGSFEPFNDISGTRSFFRKNVLSRIDEIRKSKYGITVLINDIHAKKRVGYVRLPYVYVLGKFDKQSVPDAMRTYVKEAAELTFQALRQQAKDVTPSTKKILKSIQSYLRSALEYINS